jgi:hypothetical protein
MASPDMATPATACSEPALIVERFAGKLDIDNATDRDALQVSRIVRLYAVSFATAATIARLAYAVAR